MNKVDCQLRRLASSNVWFYDRISEHFIYTRPVDVFIAEMRVNEEIMINGNCTVKNWLDFLNAKNKLPDADEEESGWSDECLSHQSEYWVCFDHISNSDKEHGLYFEIISNPLPCYGYSECFPRKEN